MSEKKSKSPYDYQLIDAYRHTVEDLQNEQAIDIKKISKEYLIDTIIKDLKVSFEAYVFQRDKTGESLKKYLKEAREYLQEQERVRQLFQDSELSK